MVRRVHRERVPRVRIFTSRHLGTVCVGTQRRHLRTILRKQCEQWCCWTSLCLPAGESVNPPGYKMMKQAYHSGEFDVLREVRLIGQGLFGGQESQVLGRDVWSREGSANLTGTRSALILWMLSTATMMIMACWHHIPHSIPLRSLSVTSGMMWLARMCVGTLPQPVVTSTFGD